jgi:membrane protease YdiL (CAAX protease family)
MLPAVRRARKPSNYSLLFVYVLPYFLYVLALMLPLPKPVGYAIALGASALALAWAWRWYVPLRGPRSALGSVAAGVAGGVLGTVLWLSLKTPTIAVADALGLGRPDGDPWAPAAFWARLVASGTVVPVFEELLFRGLLLRLAIVWDRLRRAGANEPLADALHDYAPGDVEFGAWSWRAVAITSLAFMAGHSWRWEWPAAFGYGLLMAGLWIWRKDLLAPVVAHGTTNVTLALWVRHTGDWSVW